MVLSIPSPPSNGIDLGPLEIRFYGLFYVLGVIAAVAITTRRWERQGGSRELVHEVVLWAFPAGLVGARLYYVITSWGEVPKEWWVPMAVWRGGLGVWGGIAMGTLAGVWDCAAAARMSRASWTRPRRRSWWRQAIGRLGNYFNQELFGRPTTLPWGIEIDPARRPDQYAAFETFHPTFLYELIWNLTLAGFLVWLGRRREIRPPGLFALYVAGYSGFRIVEELLRTDSAHHVLGLRLNFFVATLLCLVGLVWFWHTQRRARPRLGSGGPAVLGVICLMLAFSGCGHEPRAAASTAHGRDRTAQVRPPSVERWITPSCNATRSSSSGPVSSAAG